MTLPYFPYIMLQPSPFANLKPPSNKPVIKRIFLERSIKTQLVYSVDRVFVFRDQLFRRPYILQNEYFEANAVGRKLLFTIYSNNVSSSPSI
jgi:hypothetical protein